MWVKSSKSGFTIVELLIVIVVIAILAAITIVAFNGIQDRAKSSAAASSSAQAGKKIKVWQVENEGQSPICAKFYELVTGTTSNAPTEPTPPAVCSFMSKDTGYQYSPIGTGGYCVTTTVGNRSYEVSHSTPSQSGGCDGHGQGGVGAITNLVTNPTAATNGNGWSSITSTNGASTGARTTLVSGLSSIGVTTSWRITLSSQPDSWWRNQFGTVPVTAGQSYTFSSYIRPSITVNTGVIILWRNSSNSILSESASSFGSQAAGTWQRKSVTATAPAGATNVLLHSGSTNGGTVSAYIDSTAAMLTSGNTLYNYADGSSQDWTWNTDGTSTGPPV